jgi:ATP-dependent Clp protease ATP-binding subunit ClpC
MPKINVYLPDELANAVRAAAIPVSAVCQQALADAVAQVDGPGGAGLGSAVDPELAEGQPPTMARYTRRARTAVEHARAGAAEQGRPASTPHLVGGLVAEGGNLALTVLDLLDVDRDDLIAELRATIRSRRREGADDQPRPGSLDDACRRALEQSLDLGHNYVGCEHLLLGLAAGPDDELTAAVLHRMGVDLHTARATVVAVLAGYDSARENLTFAGISAPIRAALADIRTRLGRLEARSGRPE